MVKVILAVYRHADVYLCLPLRDGTSRRAKEYVASRQKTGVLILSELSGSADRLDSALLVNPHNQYEVAMSIKSALEMDADEQAARLGILKERVIDDAKWPMVMMRGIKEAIEINESNKLFQLTNIASQNQLIEKYKMANRRLFLFKYDSLLIDALRKLCSDRKNQVVIISDKEGVVIGK